MKAHTSILIFSLLSTICFGQENLEPETHRINKNDSLILDGVWKEFINAFEEKNTEKIKSLSLDFINCDLCTDYTKESNDYLIPIDTFIIQSYNTFIGSPLWNAIKHRGYKPWITIIKNYRTKNLPETYGKELVLYEIWIQTYLPNEWAEGHEGQSHAFQFILFENKFKFYGLTSIP